MRRWWSALGAAILVFGCSDESSPSSASSSSSSSGGASSSGSGGSDDERVDPFCSTRPRLSFCEDFDDAPLPGRFQSVDGSPAVARHDDAPSQPNVLAIDGDARLSFDAAAGIKFNLFFLVKVASPHGRLELAGFDDGDDHLVLGVEEDGHWFVTLGDKKIASPFGPKDNEFSSVRFDVYVDGAGTGHLRFRSGEDMVFEKELVTYTAGKSELKPRWFVGAKLVEGACAQVQFDSVTLGDD